MLDGEAEFSDGSIRGVDAIADLASRSTILHPQQTGDVQQLKDASGASELVA